MMKSQLGNLKTVLSNPKDATRVKTVIFFKYRQSSVTVNSTHEGKNSTKMT